MTSEAKKPKSGKWVKLVLILSLGLNLAVVSFVIGITIKGPPDRARLQNSDAVAFLSYALPKQHRREIRREMVAHREALRSNRNALHGLRAEMIEILQEEDFDLAKVAVILERQRGHFLSLGELAHDALLNRIAVLTPEERAAYIRSLQRDARPARQD